MEQCSKCGCTCFTLVPVSVDDNYRVSRVFECMECGSRDRPVTVHPNINGTTVVTGVPKKSHRYELYPDPYNVLIARWTRLFNKATKGEYKC